MSQTECRFTIRATAGTAASASRRGVRGRSLPRPASGRCSAKRALHRPADSRVAAVRGPRRQFYAAANLPQAAFLAPTPNVPRSSSISSRSSSSSSPFTPGPG